MSEGGTFREAALARLDGLWPALYQEPCPEAARAFASGMLASWGASRIPEAPPWRSDIGDDHSPFEYSVAWGGDRADLRLLVEGQGGGSAAATRRACLDLHAWLGERGADLGRFEAVADLLFPEASAVRDPLFVLWHTVSLLPGPLRAKCYLNPNLRGAGEATALMRAALERLGLPAAWRAFAAVQQQLRDASVFLFSLDLADTPSARVKVYSQPAGATVEDLERVAQVGPHYQRGEVTDFCRAMTGCSGPYAYAESLTRLPSVYFAFTGNDAVPSDVTVQIPIRFYAPDDAVARDRICSYLRARGVETASYERALAAVARRPLSRGRGLNAWVSLRTGSDPPLLTVYFAAELYRVLPPLVSPAGASSPPAL